MARSPCRTVLMVESPSSCIVLDLKPQKHSPEQFTVDLYITPCKYHETPDRLGGDLSALVQAFSEEFVVPHLRHFAERCRIEGIIPPRHYPAGQVNPSGLTFLPAPLVATGAQIQCSARPTQQFKRDFEAGNKTLSAAVQIGHALAKNVLEGASHIAEPGTATGKARGTNGMHLTSTAASFRTPLISIGPHTDAVLDRFGLDDQVLLKLHQLIGSIRSSRWEAVFRSPKWDLTYEQASNLSRSLHSDLHSTLTDPKPSSSFLSQMFMFLGTLVFVLMTQTRAHVQAAPTRRPRATLSKEACAALAARCRENSRQFKSALNDAWNNLDETVKTIASSHHKSFHRVENDLCLGRGLMKFKRTKLNTWNAFCWKKRQENNENGATGKDMLQELVKDHRVEYQALTEDEKAELLL
ncbi:hypothetical protein CY34DRAFT_19590, partial [Suillus luteus UH-Slu-Lm8-n1]